MLASTYEATARLRAMQSRQPLQCLFELTPTCNLRCHFCYVALEPYAGPYLSTAAVCRVIDVLAEAGVLWLTLTGGEIFSRRDFAEIYRYARGRGMLVTLYTNATMVTEAHARLLAELPPAGIEVSIYGADAEHYDAVTGVPGAFTRFERGMQRLLDAGLRPLMKHTASALTADHIPAVRAWCETRGLRHRFSVDIEARHDGGAQPTLYRIEPKRAADMRAQLNSAAGVRSEGPLAECGMGLPADETQDRLYRCAAGRTGFFVDALGNASHCVLDRDPAFPLLEMPWDEVWAGIGAWVEQPLPATAPCSGCSLRGGCNNCPAKARLATGSPFEKDPYHCDVTHAAYGLPPAPYQRPTMRPLAACAG